MPKKPVTLESLAGMIARNVVHKEDLKKLATKKELATQLRRSERRILNAIRAYSVRPEVEALQKEMALVNQRLEVLEQAAGIHR